MSIVAEQGVDTLALILENRIPCRLMSLFIASLNSGSNGNCYYVGNQHEAVLVDGGISCRQVEKRMKRLGLSIKKVKAVFVSHEHGDHIHGIPALSKKYRLPVYITPGTLQACNLEVARDLIMPFSAYQPVIIGGLTVTAFPKRHDASDPHSFIVAGNNVRIGVFTDIGSACEHVKNNFRQCHAAFLEANFDEQMLATGRYPLFLKDRVRSDVGHLSNMQAMELFVQHRPSFMSHLFLSHLSGNNNSPEIVQALFDGVAGGTEIVVAPRYKETDIYHIRNIPGKMRRAGSMPVRRSLLQLSLFQ